MLSWQVGLEQEDVLLREGWARNETISLHWIKGLDLTKVRSFMWSNYHSDILCLCFWLKRETMQVLPLGPGRDTIPGLTFESEV